MFTEEKRKWIIKGLIPLFIGLLSVFVLSDIIPKTKFVQHSIDNVEQSRNTVMEFSGAVLATSFAISALPDDFETPLADTLAGMEKYFVFILMVLLIEKIILMEGTKLAFLIIIPAGCIIYTIGYYCRKVFCVNFGKKLTILGCALFLVIPCSTYVTEYVCADYMEYVNETIEDTKNGSEAINGVMEEEDSEQTIFDKLSGAFETAIQGVKDLLSYFNNMIRKCINSIAMLIVTTFVLPLVNLFIFKWLLGELFHINLTIPKFRSFFKKKEEDECLIDEKIDSTEEADL